MQVDQKLANNRKRPHARAVSSRLAVIALLVGSLAAGCTSPRQWLSNGFKVGPEYCQPGVMIAEDWIDADDKRVLSDSVDHCAWWTTFNDPVLNLLVAEAYSQNLTLREAGMRIMEARSLRAIAAGNFFPQQQTANASYSHNLSTGTGFDRHFSSWNSSLNMTWELDFWGRFRRAIEAADADLQASVYDYGDVVVALIADVAATYVDIRTLQTRIELVQRNVENQRRTFQITEDRLTFGDASDVDVQQARTSLAQTEAAVPQLESAMRQSQNQLCILLGIPPEDLAERLGEGAIPTAPKEVALGIPAEMLMRRPDVRRAERLLAAQSARIGIAESDLYPQITLRGNVGVSANQFDELFRNGSSFGSVGPSLGWSILNYGRIINNVRAQDARFRQLLAAYRQAVLLANAEAENSVVQFLRSQEQLEFQLVAAEAAAKTDELITLQFAEGEVDFNRLINIQNSRTQQEQSAAIARGNVAQGLISIYRALGGGWPSPFLGQPLAALPAAEGDSDNATTDEEDIAAGEDIGAPQPDDQPGDEPSDIVPPPEPTPPAAQLEFPGSVEPSPLPLPQVAGG